MFEYSRYIEFKYYIKGINSNLTVYVNNKKALFTHCYS